MDTQLRPHRRNLVLVLSQRGRHLAVGGKHGRKSIERRPNHPERGGTSIRRAQAEAPASPRTADGHQG